MASGYVGTPNIVKLALGDGTDSIILSNISDGVDGATPTPITIEDIGAFTHEDGQHGVSGRKWSLTMSGMVSAFTDDGVAGTIANGGAKLLEWSNSETLLHMAFYTLGGYGYASDINQRVFYIDSCQKYTTPSGRVYFTVKVTIESLGEGAVNGFRPMPNLKSNIIDASFDWVSTDGIRPVGMRGNVTSGSSANDFTAGVFTITYNDTGNPLLYNYRLFFPFIGVTISLSVPYGAVIGDSVTGNRLQIIELDNGASSELGSASAVVTGSTTITVSKTLNQTALYFIDARIINALGGTDTIGDVEINSRPILRITNIN